MKTITKLTTQFTKIINFIKELPAASGYAMHK